MTLVEALQLLGDYPGDQAFDSSVLFSELADLLRLAYTRITRLEGDGPIGRVVQLFRPAWVLTDVELVSLKDESRRVSIQDLVQGAASVVPEGADPDLYTRAANTALAMHDAGHVYGEPW